VSELFFSSLHASNANNNPKYNGLLFNINPNLKYHYIVIITMRKTLARQMMQCELSVIFFQRPIDIGDSMAGASLYEA